MTRATVIIPCFNDGPTLTDAIASLRDQEEHELVVVDDGSTDASTLSRLEELRGAGVRVIHQQNRGLAAARMAGVAATVSPYVLPLDADDELLPGAVSTLADALDAAPSAMLAWGDIEVFGGFSFTVRTANHIDPWYVTYLDEIPPTPMLRRSAIERSGGWTFPDTYEDWDFVLRLAELGYDGVRVPTVVSRYRHAGERMSADGLSRHGELLEMLRRRHEELFSARGENRAGSSAPKRTLLLFPLIEGLPISARNRHRLLRLVAHPRQVMAARRARRLGGAQA